MKANDQLGNLKQAQKFLHQEQARFRNRETVLREFDNKPLNERQLLYRKHKGNNHHICFITDYEKLSIMGYF